MRRHGRWPSAAASSMAGRSWRRTSAMRLALRAPGWGVRHCKGAQERDLIGAQLAAKAILFAQQPNSS